MQINQGGKFHGCRTKLKFTGKLSWLDSSLARPKPIAQAISLEKLHSTNRSAKTATLFHLEQFAIYGMYICTYVCGDTIQVGLLASQIFGDLLK